MKQHLCFDPQFNAMAYLLPRLFPTPKHGNVGFVVMSPRNEATPAVLMVDVIPDLSFYTYTGQFFPRWSYEKVDEETLLDLGDPDVVDGYRRVDNITDEALRRWRAAYGDDLTNDDVFHYVYGLLHSPGYRARYAADLKKMLPRIPLVEHGRDFVDAGRRLSEIHLGYETARPYPLEGLAGGPADGGDAAYQHFRVQKMRFPSRGERSTVVYNERVTLTGIPEEAYRYQLGSRSAVEWVMDRYQVRTDKKSGIVNDPNDWARGVGDPRYIVDLLARIVTVSLETTQVVDALPALVVLPDQS